MTADTLEPGPGLWYLAHPVSGDVAGNIARAKVWLRWIFGRLGPHVVVIAPWIEALETLPLRDEDPQHRAIGLERMCVIVEHCAGVILVGDRVSSGMSIEARRARLYGRRVFDATGSQLPSDETRFRRWGADDETVREHARAVEAAFDREVSGSFHFADCPVADAMIGRRPWTARMVLDCRCHARAMPRPKIDERSSMRLTVEGIPAPLDRAVDRDGRAQCAMAGALAALDELDGGGDK